MNEIKALLINLENIILEIDYANSGINTILKEDKKRFDLGMIVLTNSLLNYKEAIRNIIDFKLPIFKIGTEPLNTAKHIIVVLNDMDSYEQLSPIVFDVSSQLKLKTKIFNMDPLGDNNQDKLVSHFETLSKIFNQDINIISNHNNPITALAKEQNILQILPLKKSMFNRRIIKFFNTDSDLLSFDLTKYNQLLIPIVEN
jgi:hypothetical protein